MTPALTAALAALALVVIVLALVALEVIDWGRPPDDGDDEDRRQW